jgi:hypothetical protein
MHMIIHSNTASAPIAIKVKKIPSPEGFVPHPKGNGQQAHYRCLVAMPRDRLHFMVTVPPGQAAPNLSEVLKHALISERLNEMDRAFLHQRFHALSVDPQTNLAELMELCPG